MRADLAALLHHADGRLGGKLLEADGGGEARRSGAHHDHVELHRLAFGHLRLLHRLDATHPRVSHISTSPPAPDSVSE